MVHRGLLEPSSFSCLNYNLPITPQNMNYVPLAWYIVYNNKILDLEEGGRDMAYFLAHMDFANILVDIGSKNRNSFLWCDEFLANCSEPQREGGDRSSVAHIVTHLVITDSITISSPLDITIHTQTGNTVRDNNFVSRCLNMVRCALSRSLTSITKTMTLWCSQQTWCKHLVRQQLD